MRDFEGKPKDGTPLCHCGGGGVKNGKPSSTLALRELPVRRNSRVDSLSILFNHPSFENRLKRRIPGKNENGEKGGPGGRSVDGCLFWFLCSSQICVPPYSFLKEGF